MAKGNAVAVLLVTPQGIPVVRDPKKPAPVFWKLPGGRGDASETARNCAVRGLREEIGVELRREDLISVHSEPRGNHILTIFQANLAALPQMKSQGDEGKEIRVFAPKDLLAEPGFFPNHRRVVGRIIAALG